MAIEVRVYTRRPALTWAEVADAARAEGWELRRLDAARRPPGPPAEVEDRPLAGQSLVVVGWPAAGGVPVEQVDRAIAAGDRAALDRLGADGPLAWFELGCRPYGFEQAQADWEPPEPEEDEDEDAASPDDLDRFRAVRARYSFRAGTRPARHGDLLDRVARLVRERGDGFADEW